MICTKNYTNIKCFKSVKIRGKPIKVPYSLLSSPPKNQYFPKFVRRTRQRLFLIFKNFTTFLPKEQLESCLIIKALYLKRKNKKIRRTSSQ